MSPTALVAACLVAVAVLLWPGAAAGTQQRGGTGGQPVPPDGPAGGSRGGRRRAAVPPTRRVAELLRTVRRRGRLGTVEEVQLLDGLAAALEAGLPTGHALEVALDPVVGAGAGGGAWSELARAAQEGQPLGPAWQRLARRTGSLTASSVGRAWTLAAVTGAPVAAAVRSSAHAARERRRLERAVEVATAGARATATVLGLLPVAGVGLAALLGIGPLTLYSHPLALASAALGAVLLVVGHLTVRRMVRGVLRGVS